MTNGLAPAAPVPPPRPAPSVRRGLAAAVCLPLALAGPSRGDGLAPPENEAWRQLRMERLVVCGNATEAKLRDVAASFGRLRAVLASLSPEGRARSPVPTVIVVFRDDHELQRFGLRADGRPIRASGFFRAGPDANQIGLSASWNEDPRPVVYHELLHEHVRWNLPPLPVWFEEGLAEYYSTFTASGSQATVGGIQREHLRLLRRSVPMPLEELLAVGKDSPWYTESSRRGPFYAEAWAFTHFLLHSDPTLAPRLFRYLGRTREGAGRVPGVPVTNIVDTVGAGDAFAAGAISGRLEGLDWPQALARANWVGAQVIQVVGDMDGLPRRASLPATLRG